MSGWALAAKVEPGMGWPVLASSSARKAASAEPCFPGGGVAESTRWWKKPPMKSRSPTRIMDRISSGYWEFDRLAGRHRWLLGGAAEGGEIRGAGEGGAAGAPGAEGGDGAGGGAASEGKDPRVGGAEPVALARRRRRHAGDRLGRRRAAPGAEEGGVAEAEDAPVGRHHPVAATGGGRRHPGDRLVQLDRPGRPEEPGVAEGEDAAVGGDEPVALAGRGGRHTDDRLG